MTGPPVRPRPHPRPIGQVPVRCRQSCRDLLPMHRQPLAHLAAVAAGARPAGPSPTTAPADGVPAGLHRKGASRCFRTSVSWQYIQPAPDPIHAWSTHPTAASIRAKTAGASAPSRLHRLHAWHRLVPRVVLSCPAVGTHQRPPAGAQLEHFLTPSYAPEAVPASTSTCMSPPVP